MGKSTRTCKTQHSFSGKPLSCPWTFFDDVDAKFVECFVQSTFTV